MSRGTRGGYSSSRGSSYRGGSGRGSWHSNSRGYNNSSRGGGGRLNSSSSHGSFSSSSYDRKYSSSSDKYSSGSRSHHNDDYRRSYKNDSSGYHNRDHRSPERKRMRTESSHDRSFGGSGGDYKARYENDRRSFSNDRRASSYARKDEFRKPQPPPSSPRGGYRGRANSSRGGSLRARLRDRPIRKRLVESSYAVRRRVLSGRTSDYARRLKMNKLRSTIIRRTKPSSSDKDSDVEDEKKSVKEESTVDTSDKEKTEVKEELKSPKKEKKEDGSDNEGKKDSDGETEKKGSRFIKLTCPHCQIGFTTFGKYLSHLQSGRHAASMRRVATKQKAILSQMRLVQRKAQRELEKTTEDLAPRTSWCPMCKLNYKQPKATHQASKSHLEMKRFLMPHCKICKMTYKSPMIYESHCCSLDHIKRKAALADKNEKDESGNDEDLGGNFMTIDSVGDVDEDGDSNMKEDKSKEHVNVGIEEIHKVEVYFCDLCRMYLPRVNDEEEMNREIARHCKQRTHLQKYIRHKEDRELARKAERLVRKENAEKEKEKDKDSDQTKENEMDDSKVDESNEDHKLYDMSLNEDGRKSDDEDEDEEDSVANGERYDRFRQSEKNAEEKKEAEAVGDEDAKIEVTTEDIKI